MAEEVEGEGRDPAAHFVEVDFATFGCPVQDGHHRVGTDLREDWPAALLEAGFRSSEPTAWLIEGLLMYLTEGERDRLLDRVGRLSSSESRLALEHKPFGVPETALSTPLDAHALDANGQALLAHFTTLGQSALADASIVDPAAWLARHGWRPRIHDAAEQVGACGRPVPLPLSPAMAGLVRGWLATAERTQLGDAR